MSIIEVLINRLSAQTELRLATLELFSALIDLNCEDVMLALTMKHLLPCSHVMVSQRGYALQVLNGTIFQSTCQNNAGS